MTTPGHPLGNANIRLPPPATFDGSGDFDEWKKKFRMYLLSISMRTVDILDDYMTRNYQQTDEEMTTRYDREGQSPQAEVRYLSSIVYALLSHCTSGPALATVNKAISGERLNGYEAFRHLNEHYAMNDTNKALVSFNKIANLKLHGDDLQSQLIAWEKEIATYERSMETTFSEKYKLHAVINGTTGTLHSHLSYHLRSITTYQQLRQMIFDHHFGLC